MGIAAESYIAQNSRSVIKKRFIKIKKGEKV